MDALVGFGGGSLSRRASFARQKSTDQTSNKGKKPKENESDSDEDDEKKLLNQIDGLLGNMGLVDPMTGNNKRNMSRRGSRVPAGWLNLTCNFVKNSSFVFFVFGHFCGGFLHLCHNF